MAKHLLKFNTAAEYSAATINKPAVSWVVEDNEVKYDPYVPPYVDLGLPSGTKWARMNVGAESETDTGLYFQWGDISGYTASQVGSGEGQKYFGWADYKYNPSGDGSTMTKYNKTDKLTTLEASDDAAIANLGSDWRMPTEAEFNELLNGTTNEWVTNYQGTNVNGRLFTSKTNGNTLFFPAAGDCFNGSVYNVGSGGYYWSSSRNTSYVVSGRYLYFGSGSCSMSNSGRLYGYSVRGVVE
jgi:uncharacterized protein (TIGR02145 family)